MTERANPNGAPKRIEALQDGQVPTPDWSIFDLAKDLRAAKSLHHYSFSSWQDVVYDCLVLAALVDYCDRSTTRPKRTWGRHFQLRLAVHEPRRWDRKDVLRPLISALSFLTGDKWELCFIPRKTNAKRPQELLPFEHRHRGRIIPYSDGMDSHLVASLLKDDADIVRVRVGRAKREAKARIRNQEDFVAIPFEPKKAPRRDNSGQSRGFTFAVVAGLLAYLDGASSVVVPESGQGALGPALVPLGQIARDHRSHPEYTRRVGLFLSALLNTEIRFEHPMIWQTKGETLRDYLSRFGDERWRSTRSCWRGRGGWLDGKSQCGICAACLLRRMSIHAAGAESEEELEEYAWPDLRASSFAGAASNDLRERHITQAALEYGIAGIQHLDQLARLRHDPADAPALDLAVFQLSRALNLTEEEAYQRLSRMLAEHEKEFHAFMDSRGTTSFLWKFVCRRT